MDGVQSKIIRSELRFKVVIKGSVIQMVFSQVTQSLTEGYILYFPVYEVPQIYFIKGSKEISELCVGFLHLEKEFETELISLEEYYLYSVFFKGL